MLVRILINTSRSNIDTLSEIVDRTKNTQMLGLPKASDCFRGTIVKENRRCLLTNETLDRCQDTFNRHIAERKFPTH